MIEKILFPVDFSPACAAMASFVQRAADMFHSEVTLLYVCDLASHNGFELYARPACDIAEEHWNIARDTLCSFLQSEFPPARCRRMLRSGEAAEQVANAAKAGGFDLIVMPTHAGRFRRMLLGSTTAKVLYDAECMVLTTDHAETISPRPLEHRVWVCALGLSADSERVLRTANRAAAIAGAKLTIVHVAEENTRDHAERGLRHLAADVGCKAPVIVRDGPVKEAVLAAAAEFDADLVIIGRPVREGRLGRLGDLTYALVRDSPVPVLSV
jgi:nucleotide-binding universal stress UspA family protein